MEYPLLTTKSYEFQKWCSLVDILYSKRHIGKSLSARDAILEFAIINKELNSKRNSPNKEIRMNIIIEWLQSLSDVPSMESKLELIEKIEKALNKS